MFALRRYMNIDTMEYVPKNIVFFTIGIGLGSTHRRQFTVGFYTSEREKPVNGLNYSLQGH